MKYVAWMLVVVLAMVSSSPVYGADANSVEDVNGLTVWALGGDSMQELRVGYRGLLPNIELALGGVHVDAVDDAEEEWPIRGYAIAHALSADMLASLLDSKMTLPAGTLYGGLFLEYLDDADLSGGYIVGGQVRIPKTAWRTVLEYQDSVWGDDENYQVIAGVCLIH